MFDNFKTEVPENLNITLDYLKHHLKFKIQVFSILIILMVTSNIGFSQPLKNLKDSCSIQNLALKPTQSNSLGIKWCDPLQWKNPNPAQSPEPEDLDLRDQIANYAYNFLGIRYRSSGKSPKVGFDCSGFTGFIFKQFGLQLKSSSTAQATEGKKVPIHEASTGDLAFFGRKGKKGKMMVNHAAIVISKPGEPLAIIHSASNKGIVITKVQDSAYWRNSLLFVRNIL
jgi:hypothetical protein